MALSRYVDKALTYIQANDNVSRDCALCNLTKQAMRVIAGERQKSEAVNTVFYAKKGEHPQWQYSALNEMISALSQDSAAQTSVSLIGAPMRLTQNLENMMIELDEGSDEFQKIKDDWMAEAINGRIFKSKQKRVSKIQSMYLIQ